MSIPFAFILTSFIIELTPGPNMGYLALLSAREGRRAGVAAVLGIAAGLAVSGLATALGLTALIAASGWLYAVLRWGGVLYLLWLAWEGWRSDEEAPSESREKLENRNFFVRGLLINLLNPKAGIFYIAVLPTFVSPDAPTFWQIALLSGIYVAVATLVHLGVVVMAGAARPWLENKRRRDIARRTLAILLAFVAIWLLFSTG